MEIATERCLMRPFVAEDIGPFMEYRNDAAWMRHQGFKGLERAEYEKALLCPGSFEQGMQLAIVQRAARQLIGDVYLRREGDCFWVGYTIHPLYARQGYAFEALNGLVDWARSQGSAFVKAGVLPGNLASIRLLEKMGFARRVRNEEGEWVFVLPLAE